MLSISQSMRPKNSVVGMCGPLAGVTVRAIDTVLKSSEAELSSRGKSWGTQLHGQFMEEIDAT